MKSCRCRPKGAEGIGSEQKAICRLIYWRYRCIASLDRSGLKRHHEAMQRDTETMRRLGRAGGLKSGETRRLNRAVGIIWEYAREKWGIETPETPKNAYPPVVPYMSAVTSGRLTPEEIAGAVRAWMRGGSHETDWRCPKCRHFNVEKRRSCAKCACVPRRRMSRARLRALTEQHRIATILRNHGL